MSILPILRQPGHLLTFPYTTQLANSLYQNCGKLLHLELSSRAWTGAMERLITDRTTVPQVKTKAAGYVQTWWKGLKGGESEGVLGDLIESLKTKSELEMTLFC